MRGMDCSGYQGGAYWEEFGPEIYAGKRAQHCSKGEKESGSIQTD